MRFSPTHVLMFGALGVCALGCSMDDDPNGGAAGNGGNDFGNAAPGSGNGSGSGSDDGPGGASNDGPEKITDQPLTLADDGTRWYGNFPVFPGAGTSDEAKPLENGVLCDAIARDGDVPVSVHECYFGIDDLERTKPAATLEQVLECAEEGDLVHIRLTFHPWFVDNTYGETQVGWVDEDAAMAQDDGKKKKKGGKGHQFKDLVGSDHAEILAHDADGRIVVQFKLDYISEDDSADSGYASLGVTDGDGKMIVGDASAVLGWMTSLDRNLNERGYASYTTDSPETNDEYEPNDATPEWDYRVVYEAWLDADAFGDAGFGGATIEFVHASPSKADDNTIEVERDDCPPPPCGDGDPDADCGGGGDEDDPRGGGDPDADCGGGGPPPHGDPLHCMQNPDDPECVVD